MGVLPRGLEIVSDDSPLLEAIDVSGAAQSDITEKIREGGAASASLADGSQFLAPETVLSRSR